MAADVRVPLSVSSFLRCWRNSPSKAMAAMLVVLLMVVAMSVNTRTAHLDRLFPDGITFNKESETPNSDCRSSDDSPGGGLFDPRRSRLGTRQDKSSAEGLPCHIVNNVKTLLLFVGYPRSCHSLVGSILDAHPNMVIAHEYNLLGKWQGWSKNKRTKKYVFNELYNWSRHQQQTIRHVAPVQGRYSYGVPNQWQGKYKDNIAVIGDKRGGLTSRLLTLNEESQDERSSVVTALQKALKIKIKFMHVVRNPLDNIATMCLRKNKLRNSQNGHLYNSSFVNATARRYFRRLVGGVERVKKLPYPMLDVHCEDIIKDPRKELERLCSFLDVPCPRDFVKDSASIIHARPSVTRNLVTWSDDTMDFVVDEMKKHSFLSQYLPRAPSLNAAI